MSSNERKEFNSLGCFVVLLAFSLNLIWGGVFKALGVLLPTLQDQFATETWLIGTLLAFVAISADLTGIVTILLDLKFGTRLVLVVTTLMTGVGVILISFATSVAQIALALAFLVGPGIGIPVVLNKAVLGQHFSKHYTLASGIGHSGHAVGILVFAPMTQLFLDLYGWRGAILLIGAICMHPVTCAALIKVKKQDYQLVRDEDSENGSRIDGNVCSELARASDVRILTELGFWIIWFCLSATRLANNSWMEFFVPHLVAKGIAPEIAAVICSVAGVGFFISTAIFAPAVDRGKLSCTSAIIMNSVALSISFIADPWVDTVPGQIALTFIFGMSISAMFTLLDILTKDLLGSDRLTSAFGWCAVIGALISLLAGFLPGWIYDTRDSYDLAFIIIGLTPIGALVPLVINVLRIRIKAKWRRS